MDTLESLYRGGSGGPIQQTTNFSTSKVFSALQPNLDALCVKHDSNLHSFPSPKALRESVEAMGANFNLELESLVVDLGDRVHPVRRDLYPEE